VRENRTELFFVRCSRLRIHLDQIRPHGPARKKNIMRYNVYTWEVAQDLKYRERSRYDKKRDEVAQEVIETE
jgi:hypothetical protein